MKSEFCGSNSIVTCAPLSFEINDAVQKKRAEIAAEKEKHKQILQDINGTF